MTTKRLASMGATLPLLVLLAGCTTAAPEAKLVPPTDLKSYRVVKVIDGDTLDVQIGSRKQRVRLLRIDTPERGDPYYRQATAALRRLTEDGSVSLEYEGDRKDRYGRALAYVWRDGQLVNLELVRQGWAPFYDKYGAGKYEATFRRAESEAREARRGIWSETH